MTVALGKSKDGSWKVERFATAGRHHAKSVPAGEDCFHNFELSGRKWRMLKRSAAARKLARSIAGCGRMKWTSEFFRHGKGLDTDLHAAGRAPALSSIS